METLFFVQGIVIIAGIIVSVLALVFIAVSYFLEPFLLLWRDRNTRRSRAWELKIEDEIASLKKQINQK